jgi:hypothetical protein
MGRFAGLMPPEKTMVLLYSINSSKSAANADVSGSVRCVPSMPYLLHLEGPCSCFGLSRLIYPKCDRTKHLSFLDHLRNTEPRCKGMSPKAVKLVRIGIPRDRYRAYS